MSGLVIGIIVGSIVTKAVVTYNQYKDEMVEEPYFVSQLEDTNKKED